MKIAYLTDSNSLHINIKAKYFRGSQKNRVYLFAMAPANQSRNLYAKQEYARNLTIVPFEMDDLGPRECFGNALRMSKVIRREHIQLVHIIDMEYYWYGIFLSLLGVKVVLENNGSDVLRMPELHPELKKWYRLAYFLSKGVVQDSAVARNKAMELGAPASNNEIIELGVDLKIFRPDLPKGKFRGKYGIPPEAKIVFSPRAFAPLYNIGDIIKTIPDVVKEFPDTVFVFCSYRKNPQWIRLITKLGVKQYTVMLDYVDNEKEMPYIYADSDIVVSIPSSDSSPRTVYEAMACGCATIVSDLPWLRGKFRAGRELLTVPVHDIGALTAMILAVLRGETSVDREGAWLKIKETLDYKIFAGRLKRLYRKILQGKRWKR